MHEVLHGSFYLGRPGPQLYHRYVIPAQPVATGKSNYRMTHFNASLSSQSVSCSKGFFCVTWVYWRPAREWFSIMCIKEIDYGCSPKVILIILHRPGYAGVGAVTIGQFIKTVGRKLIRHFTNQLKPRNAKKKDD